MIVPLLSVNNDKGRRAEKETKEKPKVKNAIYDYAQKNGKVYAALEGYDPNADEDDEHGEIEE